MAGNFTFCYCILHYNHSAIFEMLHGEVLIFYMPHTFKCHASKKRTLLIANVTVVLCRFDLIVAGVLMNKQMVFFNALTIQVGHLKGVLIALLWKPQHSTTRRLQSLDSSRKNS